MGALVRIEGDTIVGEVALPVPPGTKAAARDRALDALLAEVVTAAAGELHVVLAAAPSAYAFPLPGKDAEGLMRFAVRGRVEGDRLVPARPSR